MGQLGKSTELYSCNECASKSCLEQYITNEIDKCSKNFAKQKSLKAIHLPIYHLLVTLTVL